MSEKEDLVDLRYICRTLGPSLLKELKAQIDRLETLNPPTDAKGYRIPRGEPPIGTPQIVPMRDPRFGPTPSEQTTEAKLRLSEATVKSLQITCRELVESYEAKVTWRERIILICTGLVVIESAILFWTLLFHFH